MKTFRILTLFLCLLVLNVSCSRYEIEPYQVTGYWRGYIQDIRVERAGKSVPAHLLKQEQFSDQPMPFYCKLEQTGSVFVGVFSFEIDGDEFKKNVATIKRKVTGSIHRDLVSMDFYNYSVNFRFASRGNKMTGNWVRKVIGDRGEVVVAFFGVMELTRF